MQKAQTQTQQQQPQSSASQSPVQNNAQLQQSPSGSMSPGQHPFAMSNPTALAYAAQMTMPGMNMNMGMSNGSWPPTTIDDEQREAGEEAPEEVDDGGDTNARRWMQQGA